MTIERKRRKAQKKRRLVKKKRRSKTRTETVFNLIPLVVLVIVTVLVLRFTFLESKSGPPAPDFTVQDVVTERHFKLSITGKEQIVVVNFFETQCSDCQTVMQTLLQLRNKFGNDIIIVSIAPQKSADTVNSLKEYQLASEFRWFIALDTSGIAQSYGVTVLPTTIVIDRNARISIRREGVVSFAFLENEIGTLLKEQPRVGGQFYFAPDVVSRFIWFQ